MTVTVRLAYRTTIIESIVVRTVRRILIGLAIAVVAVGVRRVSICHHDRCEGL